MRSRLAIPLVIVLNLATAGIASADPGDGAALDRGAADASLLAVITDDDLFSVMDLSTVLAPLTPNGTNGTQHYGPFTSTSPDSGTCGNDWANDTFDRHFTVRANGDGTFTVVEQFKNGSFVTTGGASPGACDATDGTPPGTIDAGVVGDMHGYEVLTVTGTQSASNPGCGPGDCTTAGFIASHFIGSFTVDTFFFHYSAGDQGLVEHEWKNAWIDRGGNHGDIASSQL
jgi:hypothetical protein